MADYIRARSDEHKEERLSQIKEATAELFASCPYSEITLTTIAEKLDWSRANLYKYVTTKEEIFLEISAEKMAAYYGSLLSAFPEGNNFTPDVITEVWADSSNAVCCYKNLLVQEALKRINITPPPMDFYKDMKDFIKMRLEWKADF